MKSSYRDTSIDAGSQPLIPRVATMTFFKRRAGAAVLSLPTVTGEGFDNCPTALEVATSCTLPAVSPYSHDPHPTMQRLFRVPTGGDGRHLHRDHYMSPASSRVTAKPHMSGMYTAAAHVAKWECASIFAVDAKLISTTWHPPDATVSPTLMLPHHTPEVTCSGVDESAWESLMVGHTAESQGK
jgi:hypothetical protein